LSCGENPESGVRQVHDVRLAVLRSCSGNGPNPLLEVELVPGHLSDFLPPLRREREKLDNAAVRTPDLPGCLDHPTELFVAQHAVT
jgi:hypothetical protein